jgi:hypothetical protein
MRRALLVLLGLPGLTEAQTAARDAYLGVGFGKLAYELRADGETFLDTSSGAWRLYGGFRLSRYWQFEGSYHVTQTASRIGLPSSVAELALGQLPGARTTVRLELATLRALRLLPLSWGAVFAGFGISGAAVDTEFSVPASLVSGAGFRASKNGLTIALGADWDFRAVSLRVEYDWWDADMNALEVSMHWRL